MSSETNELEFTIYGAGELYTADNHERDWDQVDETAGRWPRDLEENGVLAGCELSITGAGTTVSIAAGTCWWHGYRETPVGTSITSVEGLTCATPGTYTIYYDGNSTPPYYATTGAASDPDYDITVGTAVVLNGTVQNVVDHWQLYKQSDIHAIDLRAGSGGVTVHANLTGLDADDHPQYPELIQDETITGHWTHTDEVTAATATITMPDGTAPLGITSTTLVPNLNVERWQSQRYDETYSPAQGDVITWHAGTGYWVAQDGAQHRHWKSPVFVASSQTDASTHGYYTTVDDAVTAASAVASASVRPIVLVVGSFDTTAEIAVPDYVTLCGLGRGASTITSSGADSRCVLRLSGNTRLHGLSIINSGTATSGYLVTGAVALGKWHDQASGTGETFDDIKIWDCYLQGTWDGIIWPSWSSAAPGSYYTSDDLDVWDCDIRTQYDTVAISQNFVTGETKRKHGRLRFSDLDLDIVYTDQLGGDYATGIRTITYIDDLQIHGVRCNIDMLGYGVNDWAALFAAVPPDTGPDLNVYASDCYCRVTNYGTIPQSKAWYVCQYVAGTTAIHSIENCSFYTDDGLGVIKYDTATTTNTTIRLGINVADTLINTTHNTLAGLPIRSDIDWTGSLTRTLDFGQTILPLPSTLTISNSGPSVANLTIDGKFTSQIATGTAPVNVTSTTLCPNLNSDQIDGYEGSELGVLAENETVSGNWFFTGELSVDQQIQCGSISAGVFTRGVEIENSDFSIFVETANHNINLLTYGGTGDIIARGDILPYSDFTFDVGSASARFQSLYLSSLVRFKDPAASYESKFYCGAGAGVTLTADTPIALLHGSDTTTSLTVTGQLGINQNLLTTSSAQLAALDLVNAVPVLPGYVYFKATNWTYKVGLTAFNYDDNSARNVRVYIDANNANSDIRLEAATVRLDQDYTQDADTAFGSVTTGLVDANTDIQFPLAQAGSTVVGSSYYDDANERVWWLTSNGWKYTELTAP